MIEVGAVLKTETAYDKDITFTRDGVEYRVILHWDSTRWIRSNMA
jgi:hypothetical protein